MCDHDQRQPVRWQIFPARERQADLKEYLRHHMGGMRGKAQGADRRDEKGNCGDQGGRGDRKKRGLTTAVSPEFLQCSRQRKNENNIDISEAIVN